MLGLNTEGESRLLRDKDRTLSNPDPGRYGQLWANYGPGFPIEIIITVHHSLLSLHTVR